MPSRSPKTGLARARRACSLAAVALWCVGAAWGQQPGEHSPRAAVQRQSIEAERKRIEATYAAELARCEQRFAVTACVDDARQRRRVALAGPRARELALDDAERRSRAAARRQAVQDKRRRAAQAPVAPRFELSLPPAAASQAAAAPASATAEARAASAPTNAAATAAAPAVAASAVQHSAAARAAAGQRARAAQERQSKIQAEQARIAARQAERARAGKPAAPLPVPAASGAKR